MSLHPQVSILHHRHCHPNCSGRDNVLRRHVTTEHSKCDVTQHPWHPPGVDLNRPNLHNETKLRRPPRLNFLSPRVHSLVGRRQNLKNHTLRTVNSQLRKSPVDTLNWSQAQPDRPDHVPLPDPIKNGPHMLGMRPDYDQRARTQNLQPSPLDNHSTSPNSCFFKNVRETPNPPLNLIHCVGTLK